MNEGQGHQILASSSPKEIESKNNKPRCSAIYDPKQALFMGMLVNERRELAMAVADDLIMEYDCKTPSEKMLAQMAAISFVKAADYSELLHDCTYDKWHSSQKNGFFSMVGKEADRANRLFISTIATLKQLKAPSFEINVTAKTAFVAQNQQFNANQENNENIKPK